MAVFYFDASALAKRYSKEVGTEVVNALFDNSSSDIATSFFTVLELSSVLSRLRKTGIPKEQTDEMEGALALDLAELSILPLEEPFVKKAIGFIRKYFLKAPDSLQLSACLGLKELLPGLKLVFVCSDKPLCTAAKLEGLIVLDPTEDGSMEILLSLLGD